MKVLPKEHRIRYNIQIIRLGREICRARCQSAISVFRQAVVPFMKKKQRKAVEPENGRAGKRLAE